MKFNKRCFKPGQFQLRLLFLTVFLFSYSFVQSQKYIMKTNVGGCALYQKVGSGDRVLNYWIASNGKWICPIVQAREYLIFDQKPTEFMYDYQQKETYSCNGRCGDAASMNLYVGNVNSNCQLIEGNGYGDGSFNPYFEIMSNQVLVNPGVDNTFCDKIILKAVGCTGTQRFFWEYSTNGINYNSINVNTGFNESYEFIKSSFLPSNYVGYVYFRVLIDSDPSITGENVYSNIIFYNIIPCSPTLVGEPVVTQPTCSYNTDGRVSFTFGRELIGDEQYEMSLKDRDGVLIDSRIVTKTMLASPTTYIWKDLSAGIYSLKYNTEITINAVKYKTTVVSAPLFKITAPPAFSYDLEYTDVTCNDSNDGTIAIKILSGAGPYKFYQDGVVVAPEFLASTGKYYLKGLKAKEGGYKIKVTDIYDCIEKQQ